MVTHQAIARTYQANNASHRIGESNRAGIRRARPRVAPVRRPDRDPAADLLMEGFTHPVAGNEGAGGRPDQTGAGIHNAEGAGAIVEPGNSTLVAAPVRAAHQRFAVEQVGDSEIADVVVGVQPHQAVAHTHRAHHGCCHVNKRDRSSGAVPIRRTGVKLAAAQTHQSCGAHTICGQSSDQAVGRRHHPQHAVGRVAPGDGAGAASKIWAAKHQFATQCLQPGAADLVQRSGTYQAVGGRHDAGGAGGRVKDGPGTGRSIPERAAHHEIATTQRRGVIAAADLVTGGAAA